MVHLVLLDSDSILTLYLSGMEGGPVFNEHAQLIGILTRPLRQKTGGAEIQVTSKHSDLSLTSLNCSTPHVKVTTLASGNSW